MDQHEMNYEYQSGNVVIVPNFEHEFGDIYWNEESEVQYYKSFVNVDVLESVVDADANFAVVGNNDFSSAVDSCCDLTAYCMH
mmetsp:Transcript_13552/g.16428  ORF Transcript_13552/g.16428 Transcript_13552/m.16428 type:complete len:83 (-) Transcript_13552:776-1024(-)